MGFLDKAKSTFSERFGDEVVRKGTFGAREDESEADEPQEKPARAPKPKRQPKPPRQQRRQDPAPEEPQDDSFGFDDQPEDQGSYDFPESEEAPVIDPSELAKLAKDQGQSVSDILKAMKINETFTIDDGILFLDEELANQEFATQAPYGYDMGEVDFFLTKTQRSVAEYVKLLRRRNDDVVALATRVSDIMVELNNLRFNSEVANGINIMASGGDEDALVVELNEARARARQLQDQLEALQGSGSVSTEQEQREVAKLRNELAAERIAKAGFEAEAHDLRAHLVLLEEEYDIQVFSERGDLQEPAVSGYDSYEEQRNGQFQEVVGSDRASDELYAEEGSYQSVGRDHWLPNLEDDAALPGLPDEDPLPSDGFDDYSSNESFEFEDLTLEELPIGSFEGSDGGFEQSDGSFQDSAFTADPYQNLDEFIEDNISGFPEDNRSSEPVYGTMDHDDPDEDGFEYSFERRAI